MVISPGVAGSGKSSAMAKLVLDWAENDEPADLDQQQTNILREKFDFVFMLLLKAIDCDISLEKVIIQQLELENKAITEDEIKTVLDNSNYLLILDGYDEYRKGTNSAIDSAVSGKRGNSFVLITSRPGYMEKEDRDQMDGKIQINGLSDKNVIDFINRYFDEDQISQSATTSEDPEVPKVSSQEFKTKVRRLGRAIYGLLKIPILLLMVIVLFVETESLPEKRTDIMWEVIQIYIKRAKKKGIQLADEDELWRHLGELSYDASQRDTHQQKIKKVRQIICKQ